MSNKLIRKALSFMLVFITVLCLVPSFHKADAAASWPEVSESKTILFYSRRVIRFYKSKVCDENNRYNSIPKNSECYVLSITQNPKLVLRVSYNGVKGYVYADRVFDNLTVMEKRKSKAEVSVYKYKTTQTAWSKSYVEIGDDVWKIKEDNGRVQIIYKAKSGSRWYKLAYVTTEDYNIIKNSYKKNTAIVNVAKTQIGKGNVYLPGYAWCAAFVSWCADNCDTGTKGSIIKYFQSCSTGVQTFKNNHRWVDVGKVKPKEGWIVFFDNTYSDDNLDGNPDHVGIVSSVNGSKITVIEGNCDSKVKENTYNIGSDGLGAAKTKSNQIIGYGTPKY